MKWTPTDDKQDYGIPWWLYRLSGRLFGRPFTLDAAAHAGNAKCPNYLTEADDALSQLWPGNVWLNPPYARGTMKRWLPHAARSARSALGERVVCLIPVRPGSKWWSECVDGIASQVWFVPFRIKFIGGEGGARFDACLVVYDHTPPANGKTDYAMLPVTDADLADDLPPCDTDFLSRCRYPSENAA